MKTQPSQIDHTQLLNQLNKLSKAAKSGDLQQAPEIAPQQNQFGNMLTKAIDTVNRYQMEAGKAATQIESGDGGVSLVKAMIASQKSNVAFQSAVQVRNRLVSAYQDIMNMPI